MYEYIRRPLHCVSLTATEIQFFFCMCGVFFFFSLDAFFFRQKKNLFLDVATMEEELAASKCDDACVQSKISDNILLVVNTEVQVIVSDWPWNGFWPHCTYGVWMPPPAVEQRPNGRCGYGMGSRRTDVAGARRYVLMCSVEFHW